MKPNSLWLLWMFLAQVILSCSDSKGKEAHSSRKSQRATVNGGDTEISGNADGVVASPTGSTENPAPSSAASPPTVVTVGVGSSSGSVNYASVGSDHNFISSSVPEVTIASNQDQCEFYNDITEPHLHWYPSKDTKDPKNDGICTHKSEKEYLCNKVSKTWISYDSEKYPDQDKDSKIASDEGLCVSQTEAQYECENYFEYQQLKYAWNKSESLCLGPDMSVEEKECLNGPTPFADKPGDFDRMRQAENTLGYYFRNRDGNHSCYSALGAAACIAKNGPKAIYEDKRCFKNETQKSCEKNPGERKKWVDSDLPSNLDGGVCVSIEEYACRYANPFYKARVWDIDPVNPTRKMCFDSPAHRTCREKKKVWTGVTCSPSAEVYCTEHEGKWILSNDPVYGGYCKSKEEIACTETRRPPGEWFESAEGGLVCMNQGAKSCLHSQGFWWEKSDGSEKRCFTADQEKEYKQQLCSEKHPGFLIFEDPKLDPTGKKNYVCLSQASIDRLNCQNLGKIWYRAPEAFKEECHEKTDFNLQQAKKNCEDRQLDRPPELTKWDSVNKVCIDPLDMWAQKCRTEEPYKGLKKFFVYSKGKIGPKQIEDYDCQTGEAMCTARSTNSSQLVPYPDYLPPEQADSIQCVTPMEKRKMICNSLTGFAWAAVDPAHPDAKSCIRKLQYVLLTTSEKEVDAGEARVFKVTDIPKIYNGEIESGYVVGRKVYCPIGQTIIRGGTTPLIPAIECGLIQKGSSDSSNLTAVPYQGSGDPEPVSPTSLSIVRKIEGFSKRSFTSNPSDPFESESADSSSVDSAPYRYKAADYESYSYLPADKRVEMTFSTPRIAKADGVIVDQQTDDYYCFGNYVANGEDTIPDATRYFCIAKYYLVPRENVAGVDDNKVDGTDSLGHAKILAHVDYRNRRCTGNGFESCQPKARNEGSDYNLYSSKDFVSIDQSQFSIPGLFFWVLNGNDHDSKDQNPQSSMIFRPELINFLSNGCPGHEGTAPAEVDATAKSNDAAVNNWTHESCKNSY